MKKAFIVGGDRFNETDVLASHGYEVVDTMEDAELVVFTGGEDINPAIYTQKKHSSVYFNEARDAFEIAEYLRAKKLGKKMLGICRGAQLLNCLVGGSLYQDVNNHQGTHAITTEEGDTFLTTSVHHQMMVVGEGAIVKAWAQARATRRLYMSPLGREIDDGAGIDPEIVVYPAHNMVLVQGHPEFGQGVPSLQTFRDYVFKQISSLE